MKTLQEILTDKESISLHLQELLDVSVVILNEPIHSLYTK
jgi:hypothetical protein